MTEQLITLHGDDEFTAFHHQRLRDALHPVLPKLRGARMYSLYLAMADERVDEARLRELLGVREVQLPDADLTVFVVPRLGVTSPWSSKATDIARVCGLVGLRRLEHGRVLLLDGIDVIRMLLDEAFGGVDHCRQAAFHVGGAASVQVAITQCRLEGVAAPRLARAGRDNIRMAGKNQQRRASAVCGPQVGDAFRIKTFALKAEFLQPFTNKLAATGVVRRQRAAGDKRLQEGQDATACGIFGRAVRHFGIV